MATISRNHDNIQRELQIANNGLTQFTTKQQALQIEKAQKQQPWLLLDPKLATVNNPNPVSNSAKLNLALGGILGLLLGVGAALVVDKLSDIFYTAQELKDTTRLPLLGIVPLRKELEPASETKSIQRVTTTKSCFLFRGFPFSLHQYFAFGFRYPNSFFGHQFCQYRETESPLLLYS